MSITSFKGNYNFLSNFYPCTVTYNGLTFSSVEAAFQAQKDPVQAAQFINLSPAQAKRLGRSVKLRADWENVKLNIMHDLLQIKFNNPELRTKLLNTKSEQLVEENTWHDTYWGVNAQTKQGLNMLGKLLMQVRNEIYLDIF